MHETLDQGKVESMRKDVFGCSDDSDPEPDEDELPADSDLKSALALSLKASGLGAAPTYEPECVICLEPFDDHQPRVPTLCRCGLDRGSFHRPCLLEWVAKSGGGGDTRCPSCDATLFYEDTNVEPGSHAAYAPPSSGCRLG